VNPLNRLLVRLDLISGQDNRMNVVPDHAICNLVVFNGRIEQMKIPTVTLYFLVAAL